MPTKTTSSAEWIPPYSSSDTECPACGEPGVWDGDLELVESGSGYDAICTLNCENEDCDEDSWQFEATVRDNFSIPDEPCDKCGSDDGEFEPDIDSAEVNGDYITVEGEFHCYTCDEDDDAKPVSPPEKWEEAKWSNFELDREQLKLQEKQSRTDKQKACARNLSDIEVGIVSSHLAFAMGGFADSNWRFTWSFMKQPRGDYYAPSFASFWNDATLDVRSRRDADEWIDFTMYGAEVDRDGPIVEASFLPEKMQLSDDENRQELRGLIKENFGSLFAFRLELYGFNPLFLEPVDKEWEKPYPHETHSMIDTFAKDLAWMDQYGLRGNPSGSMPKTIGLLAGGVILGWLLKKRLD